MHFTINDGSGVDPHCTTVGSHHGCRHGAGDIDLLAIVVNAVDHKRVCAVFTDEQMPGQIVNLEQTARMPRLFNRVVHSSSAPPQACPRSARRTFPDLLSEWQ